MKKDDPENWKLKAFCVAGQHPGEEDLDRVDGEPQLPSGWRMVRVQRVGNHWEYNPMSPASICCCPHHHVHGEPANN